MIVWWDFEDATTTVNGPSNFTFADKSRSSSTVRGTSMGNLARCPDRYGTGKAICLDGNASVRPPLSLYSLYFSRFSRALAIALFTKPLTLVPTPLLPFPSSPLLSPSSFHLMCSTSSAVAYPTSLKPRLCFGSATTNPEAYSLVNLAPGEISLFSYPSYPFPLPHSPYLKLLT